MSAAFTPGPWSPPVPNEYGLQFSIADSEGGPIAKVWGLNEEAHANARLIAAAPKLYEAAMAAIGLVEPLTKQGEDAIWRPANAAWEALVAATREARGEQ